MKNPPTHENLLKLIKITNLINSNNLESINKEELNFHSYLGNITHITVYLRRLDALREVLRVNTRNKALLNETNEEGLTPQQICEIYDFKEFLLFFKNLRYKELAVSSYVESVNESVESTPVSDISNSPIITPIDKPMHIPFKEQQNKHLCIKEGELKKYVNFTRGFKRRYVTLKKDKILYYETNMKIKETILLKNIYLKEVENENDFKIVDYKMDKSYLFRCESAEECMEWKSVINEMISCYEKLNYENYFYNNLIFKILVDSIKFGFYREIIEIIGELKGVNLYLKNKEIDEDFLESSQLDLSRIYEEQSYEVKINETKDTTEYNTELKPEMLSFNQPVQDTEEFYDAQEDLEILKTENYKREILPSIISQKKKLNIWELIGNSDSSYNLLSFKIPVSYHEPLSLLQRMSEDLLFRNLLVSAANASTKEERIKKVAAFAVSCCYPTKYRSFKPFNPLLGETYEIDDTIVEQVTPSTSILRTHNEYFTYECILKLNTTISPSAIILSNLGECKLTFNDGEIYTWKKPDLLLKGYFLGDLEISYSGRLEIHSKIYKAKIKFKNQNWFKTAKENIKGKIFKENSTIFTLKGNWERALLCQDPKTGNEELLWEGRENFMPEYYNMTMYAIQLNYIDNEIRKRILNTDSRLRPDIRALEYGRIRLAEENKGILESRQKTRRRMSKNFSPRFFKHQNNKWVYLGYGEGKGEKVFDL